ncbi:MAG: hypothetical protein RLZZ366_1796 [Pseudomonadota bacterium]
MARFARLRRDDVRGALAFGRGAIVTIGASAGDALVIEGGGRPGDRLVTILAGIACRQVSRGLAFGGGAIVTC